MKDVNVLYTKNYNILEEILKELNIGRNISFTCIEGTQYHKDVNSS